MYRKDFEILILHVQYFSYEKFGFETASNDFIGVYANY